MTMPSLSSSPTDPVSAPSVQAGSVPFLMGAGKASRWGFVLRVLFFLSGLAIGVQTAVLLLRDGGAHLPLILGQAAIATRITVAAFALLLKLTAGEPELADPWLLQVLSREDRASVLVDRDGKLVFANMAYVALVRRLAAEAACDPVPPPAFLLATHGEYAAAAYRLAEALRQGQPLSETVALPPPLWRADHGQLNLSVQPIVGVEGSPVAGLWQFSELAGQPAVKPSASFDSLQQATDVLDQAPVGHLSLSPDGRVLQINATLAHWLNWDLALFFSGERAVQEMFASDCSVLLASMAGETAQALRHPAAPSRFDLILKRADGGRMQVELIHKVEFDAQGVALPSCGIVIPARTVPVELQGSTKPDTPVLDPLRAARAPDHSMVMFNTAPIGVAILDKNGEITSSNHRFEHIFSRVGLSSSSKTSSVLTLLPADQQGPLAYALHQATHQDGPLSPLNIALGDERSVRLHLARAYGGRDEAAYLFAVETTEQRNLEAQFAQAQKMQAVGELAGGIAHDFNNVLQGILGFTDLLLVSHRPTDPSFQDLMQIKSNATRAAGLVRQLLAFSRRQTLRPRVVSLNDAVTDVSPLLRRLMGESVPLDIKLGRDLWPVMADPGQFEQAVLNLAVNARDAMPDGGRLTIRTRNVTAADCAAMADTVKTETDLPQADYVVFEIEDSGIGIAPQVISKIFQPFFTTKEVGKGTGLGLSMVYGFVKQSGGFIFCRSDVGQGTCFTIILPRLDEKDAVQPEAETPASPAGPPADLTGAGTILLVEDEDAVRAFAARALSQRGYTVYEAASGAEALDVFALHSDLDLIVSDVVMPEMDGPTMLRQLRKQGATVKVIFVSGYAEEAFAKNLPDGEDFGFLPKPFTLKQLIETVKNTLATRT